MSYSNVWITIFENEKRIVDSQKSNKFLFGLHSFYCINDWITTFTLCVVTVCTEDKNPIIRLKKSLFLLQINLSCARIIWYQLGYILVMLCDNLVCYLALYTYYGMSMACINAPEKSTEILNLFLLLLFVCLESK